MRRKALVAEFISTFALVFVGVGAIAVDSMIGGKSGLIGVALAHGLVLAVMISATMAISGGHVNPAVTIGAWAAKKIDTVNAIGYILAQCLGAEITPLQALNIKAIRFRHVPGHQYIRRHILGNDAAHGGKTM